MGAIQERRQSAAFAFGGWGAFWQVVLSGWVGAGAFREENSSVTPGL